MKKFSIPLLIAILLSLVVPAASAVSASAEAENSSYIVKLKDSSEEVLSLFEGVDISEISEDANLYRVESLSDVRSLGNSVEYYEENCTATLFALTNDRYSDEQWALEFLNMGSVWNGSRTGSGVKVAVIDSGVNSMHEDFDGTEFERGTNVLDGSHDVSDQSGHGTFVSGALAAVRNNNLGIAGFCDDVVLVPIKCFGADTETDASYVVSGIYAAVDIYGCDVINLSLGMTKDLKSVREAIDYAVARGVIVVAAVGNNGVTTLNYPAAYDNVIGVGAVDSKGKVASFSQKNSSVFLTAPGVDIVGLWYDGEDSYSRKSGTSFATPCAVAAAVLMKQESRYADVDDFKALLMNSVVDAGTAGYDTSYGYGVLDMAAFVNRVDNYTFTFKNRFTDIESSWAKDYILSCVEAGFFNGVSTTTFAPEMAMNRAMFVTVLARMSGESISGYYNTFTDVPDDAYYAQACAWGSATGIVKGQSAGIFSPDSNVSREQIATFLYRYATISGQDTTAPDMSVLNSYSDAGSISDYAKQAMAWAVKNGLITGRTTSTLAPNEIAKRAEVAKIVVEFNEKFGG